MAKNFDHWFVFVVFILLAFDSKADILHAGPDGQNLIGFGINSQTGQLRNQCVYGDQRFQRNEKIEFNVHLSASSEELFSSSVGSSGLEVDLWLIGGKANQTFLISSSESDRRMSVVWEVDYEQGTLVLENLRYSLIGESVLDRPTDKIMDTCGDQFVHAAKLGGRMYLATTITFSTKAAYREFRAKFSVSLLLGLIKFEKEFVKSMKDNAGGALFTVQAMQLGGDRRILENLKIPLKQRCSREKIDHCVATFKKLYHYMFAEDGFRQSFANLSKENPFPLYFYTEKYDETGFEAIGPETPLPDQGDPTSPFAVLDEEIFIKIDRLVGTIADLEIEIEYAKSQSEIADFTAQKKIIQDEVAKLQKAVAVCQSSSYEECSDLLDKI